MPGIFYQPVDRREFLGHSARALALLALSKHADVLSQDAAGAEKPVHLALLSDTHVPADSKGEYRKFLPWENLKTVVPQVIEARPEGIILNGDAARLTGELADYEAVKQLLAPLAEQAPVYIGLGNHDDRDNFFKVFDHPSGNRQKVAGKHVLVIERPSMRLIILDSLFYVNKAAGLLGKAQRDWLARYLEASDVRPTVIFVHHTLGDGDGDLLDVERLFLLTRPRKTVKAIIFGHSHKYAFSEEDGIHLINIPAVGYNFSDDEPVGWVEAVFTAKGVDLKLRAFAGNRAADGKSRSLSWRT
jgi:3',5'-cyclic AMP phosphodiesterase CpdA